MVLNRLPELEVSFSHEWVQQVGERLRQLSYANQFLPSAPSYPGESRFSRDEAKVAYAWNGADGYQLRVVALDGTGARTLTNNPEHEWLSPVGWSPDNSKILAKINSRGDIGQIAWVTVASGEVQVLKSMPWTSLGNVVLSDDGKNVAYDADTDSSPRTRTILLLAADGSRQVAATDGASREEVIAWTPDGSALAYLSFPGGAARTHELGSVDLHADFPALVLCAF